MPTEQPASAPDTVGPNALDDATAAAVLHDTEADKTPGTAAGLPAAGAIGGTTPNSPIDTQTPGTGDAAAGGEARLRASSAD